MGVHFLYADASDARLKLSNESTLQCSRAAGGACDTTSPFALTVAQLYKSGVSSLAWNDQPQNGDAVNGEIFAHAKGMLGFDDDAGVFISHSAPNTPTPLYQNYFDPTPYGQHFFCSALSADDIGTSVVQMLRMNNVFVDSSTSTSVSKAHLKKYPDIQPLLDNTASHDRTPTSPPYDASHLSASITTRGGASLLLLAKKGCNPSLANFSCSDYSQIP